MSSCNNVKKKTNDWEKRGLKGKVSSIFENHFLAKLEFGNVVRQNSDSLYDGIDENKMADSLGLDTSKFPQTNNPILIGPFGIEENGAFYFNKKGFITTHYSRNNKGLMESYNNYYYDDKNRKLKEAFFDVINGIKTAKSKGVHIWYDKSSRKDDSIAYIGNESFQYRKDFSKNDSNYYLCESKKYDANNNLIEEIGYYPSKLISYRRVCQYDLKERLTSDVEYVRDSVLSKTEYSYVENIKTTFFKGNKIVETYLDSSFNIVSGSVDDDGTTTFKYDSLGNVTNWKFTSSIFPIFSFDYIYKYEYDKQGNWIKRVKYKTSDKSIPIELTEREIHYYKDGFSKKDILFFILGVISCAVLIGIIKWIVKKYKVKR